MTLQRGDLLTEKFYDVLVLDDWTLNWLTLFTDNFQSHIGIKGVVTDTEGRGLKHAVIHVVNRTEDGDIHINHDILSGKQRHNFVQEKKTSVLKNWYF